MKLQNPDDEKRLTANSANGRSAAGKGGATTSPQTGGTSSASNRAARAAERRAAIVAAGLDEFTARGFAATRLDDVAKRAGVAKGTIYLHFKDKEALFQELVRTALVPLIGNLDGYASGRRIGRATFSNASAETFVR